MVKNDKTNILLTVTVNSYRYLELDSLFRIGTRLVGCQNAYSGVHCTTGKVYNNLNRTSLYEAIVISIAAMKTYLFAQILVLLPSVTVGFLPQSKNGLLWSTPVSKMSSQDNDNNAEELLLSASDVNAQMAKLRSKYPTSEADYLAAARARNVAKQASSERTATDADWRNIAAEKKQAVGEVDDWESSKLEAGNSDSQILIPLMSTNTEDGDEEPKLMLF